MRGSYRDNLMGRPSVVSDRCAVCGRYASNLHHVVQKGMGGVSRDVERRIPKVALCGSGTTGCHGLVHERRLHLNWCDGMGGWVWWQSPEPMDDELAWRLHAAEYRPMRGWIEQQAPGEVFGRGERRML